MESLYFNYGWVCPKCGRVFSPFTASCWFCPPNIITGASDGGQPITVSPLTVGPVGCTCGQTSGTGVCPIHGGNTCLTTRLD